MSDDATVAGLLRARQADESTGLRAGDDSWSWAEVVRESAERASLLSKLRRPGPFHVGVLLDNVPEYVFWLGAAALAGAAVVGVNPTRRGAELESDVAHTDCQLLVTDSAGAALLVPAAERAGAGRLLSIDDPGYRALLTDHAGAQLPPDDVDPSTLMLLLFTSGTTGAPKAVRCTQGRLARIAAKVNDLYGVSADDVCYSPMPLYHGNALMALWAPAARVGACVALAPRFSASGFLADVRRYGATYFTYVGKALTYVLATPERPDDADNTLRLGFGNEASDLDIERFERRFGCRIVEGYGASEGGAAIVRVPGTPPGSLGRGPEGVIVADPSTGRECPPARFGDGGALLNADEAVGEIVNRGPTSAFEGYYRNEEADAERSRDGWYWSGDLAYRDEDGFFYFAGRAADWLRVDGENVACAPVERILQRFPGVVMAAVYAVPDVAAGDQAMAALELAPGEVFDPDEFGRFLDAQPDLGTKWAPRFVRLVAAMPLTASNKVLREPLRAERWECDDTVWWRPARGERRYRPLDDDGRAALRTDLEAHGRLHLLT